MRSIGGKGHATGTASVSITAIRSGTKRTASVNKRTSHTDRKRYETNENVNDIGRHQRTSIR